MLSHPRPSLESMSKPTGRPRTPIKDRLLAKVIERPAPVDRDVLGRPIDGPCWIYTGKLGRNGYGVIWDSDNGPSGGMRPAHRVAYEQFIGPITEDEPDHLCRVPACVSPWHLEDVTKSENARRAVRPARPDHCRQGHPFTPETTRIERNGNLSVRRCTICDNARRRRRHREKVGLPADMPVQGVPDPIVCAHGHPWATFAEWVNVHGKRRRRCAECRRINARAWQAKQRSKHVVAA